MSIAPHTHCRDGKKQRHKETVAHALEIAYRTGESGIVDMPNPDPPLDTYHRLKSRIDYAAELQSSVFYGLYAGVTASKRKIKEILRAYHDFFPQEGDMVGIVGLKMFAGKSVGDLSVIEEENQQMVYEALTKAGFYGVLAVHCEKEALLKHKWKPEKPITHCRARPPEAEIASVEDQIRFAKAAGFRGKLHILHTSTPETVRMVQEAREEGLKITCGVTPHHCLLNENYMNHHDGLLYKVNPPLRSRATANCMLELLLDGQIDIIESDHAPHTFEEKTGQIKNEKGRKIYMSGFPGLAFRPWFFEILLAKGLSESALTKLNHTNIEKLLGIHLPKSKREPEMDLHTEYPVDVHASLRKRFEKSGVL